VLVRQHGSEVCSFPSVKCKWGSTGGNTITSECNGTFSFFGIKYYFFLFVLNEDE
jgi:hypothetical protein